MKQQEKTTVENLGEAISVLVQAVNIAQAKGGVYTFGDAAKINSALLFVDEVAKANQTAQGPTTGETATTEEDLTVEK
jgi:hypothetical protein